MVVRAVNGTFFSSAFTIKKRHDMLNVCLNMVTRHDMTLASKDQLQQAASILRIFVDNPNCLWVMMQTSIDKYQCFEHSVLIVKAVK